MASHHDKLFRLAFSDPQHARELLRSLLPEALRDAADWTTLQRVDGSLVDEQLAERHTDLLFQVELAGRRAFIFLLLEHQSSIDPWMPLRMLGYVMRIWERYRGEHPEARRLPLVCPLVLHHSHGGWRGPRTLAELVELEQPLAQAAADFVPELRFVLLDLGAHDDEALQELVVSDLGALVVSALKHAPYDPDFLDNFPQWVEAWRRAIKAPGGVAALGAVARYVLEVRENLTVDDFRAVLQSSVSEDAAGAIMTVAEQLRQEGRAEGRAEGEAKGRAEAVLKLLALRFGELPAAVEQRVRGASLEQLDRFTEQVLSAESLEEALR